ncbi:MAG: carbohydrate ABC transporter permease [Limnochordia bacterium]|jgi:ABC-type glycerol-3-phosphate transport system permease component
MQDTLLLRMRQAGWFDLLVFFLVLAIILVGLGVAGLIQYNVQMSQMAEDLTEFEIRQNLGMLALRRGSFLNIGQIALVAVLLGFALLALSSYLQDKVSLQTKKNLGRLRVVMQYVVALVVTLIMLFPIYWMIISSLKTSTELLYPVPTLWPREFQWQNFPNVLNRAPFVRYLFNTLVSTFFVMLGQVVLGVLAAYGFAKGKFKGQNVLFLLVLGALMVPIQVTFVPIYVMISRLGWINSFPGLIVPNLVSAYFIFMLRQAFKSVDESYLDAGRVDGLGRIGLIWHVLVPMTKPTLITISIITFISGWNSYFWPKMVATRDEFRTIAVGVTRLRQTFAGMETANYNEIMAGAVMAIIPIVLLFLVLQKYIMTGMSKAAMK